MESGKIQLASYSDLQFVRANVLDALRASVATLTGSSKIDAATEAELAKARSGRQGAGRAKRRFEPGVDVASHEQAVGEAASGPSPTSAPRRRPAGSF